jgi:CMP-N,N'-diacetyllegionaminic acid synthase
MKFLCVIPARGGSKGIKNKNIVKLKNKKLIEYTLQIANKIKSINKSILSSDSEKILSVAKKYKNISLHKRPEYLASDNALTIDTIRLLIKEEKKIGKNYDYVIILMATSPLRKLKHVKDCINLVKKKKPDSLVSVHSLGKPLEWLLEKSKKGFLNEFMGKGASFGNRQNKKEYFFPNGAIFILSTKKINQNGYYFNRTIPYEMKYFESLDIDHKEDLDLVKKFI